MELNRMEEPRGANVVILMHFRSVSLVSRNEIKFRTLSVISFRQIARNWFFRFRRERKARSKITQGWETLIGFDRCIQIVMTFLLIDGTFYLFFYSCVKLFFMSYTYN